VRSGSKLVRHLIGRSGFQDLFAFSYEGSSRIVRVELYLDVGDKEQNKAIFDRFIEEREAIESEFGEPLVWDRRDDVRMSKIYVKRQASLEDAPEALDELKKWGAERMLRFRRVFGQRAKVLVLPLPIADENELVESSLLREVGDEPDS
jgi:hypothetical protein